MSISVETNHGPFDVQPWPEKLTARVVTPGAQPRIHGYDAEGDLALYHPFADTVLLSLTGELPQPAASRAFEVVLHFLAPTSLAQAPAHAAVVAKVCAASTSALLGTGALGLAEQARFVVAHHEAWIAALNEARGESPPPEALASDSEDRASVSRLRTALRPTSLSVPALAHDLTRDAAVIAVVHACGLRRAEQIEVAMVFARIPALMAEALAAPMRGFRDYPMNLPPFRYEAS